MSISNTIILQLNLIAAVVLLTIACALLFRKNNVKANILLGLLFLYPAITIIINVIFIVFHKHKLVFLAPVNIGFNLTFGPVLLGYLHLLQGRGSIDYRKRMLDFIPAFVVFASAVYFYFIPEREQLVALNTILTGNNHYINAINLLLLLHICLYLYLGWRRTKLYQEKALELGMSETSLNWQKALLGCITTLNFLLILAYLLPLFITGQAHIYSDLIAAPLTALLMYVFMIYRGITYHTIYSKPAYQSFTAAVAPLNSFIEEIEASDNLSKYSNEMVDKIKAKLDELFNVQKVHTKPVLKLHDVARMLDMSPAVLSVFINNYLKITFFEMINRYRTEEAKRLLIHPNYQQYKIEYIGEISGFNSRASFFSVFKKQVGKTPQAYRDGYFSD